MLPLPVIPSMVYVLLLLVVPETVITSPVVKPSSIQLPVSRVIVSPVTPTSANVSVGWPLSVPTWCSSTFPLSSATSSLVNWAVSLSRSTRPSVEMPSIV